MIEMYHVGHFKDQFYSFSIHSGGQKLVLAASSPEERWDWKRTLLAHGAELKEDIIKEGFLAMTGGVRSLLYLKDRTTLLTVLTLRNPLTLRSVLKLRILLAFSLYMSTTLLV